MYIGYYKLKNYKIQNRLSFEILIELLKNIDIAKKCV